MASDLIDHLIKLSGTFRSPNTSHNYSLETKHNGLPRLSTPSLPISGKSCPSH